MERDRISVKATFPRELWPQRQGIARRNEEAVRSNAYHTVGWGNFQLDASSVEVTFHETTSVVPEDHFAIEWSWKATVIK